LLGAGTCVGTPVEGADVTILRITDDPITEWTDDLIAPDGTVGEICVTGSSITREYFGLPRANALAKIVEGDTVWHRIGDLGYFDEHGRLWFCGRKNHRVRTPGGTLFSECIEPVVNRHPAVARCALIGVGPPAAQTPFLIVERKPGRTHGKKGLRSLTLEILALTDGVFNHRQETNGAGSSPPSLGIALQIGRAQIALFQSTFDDRESPILYRRSLPVDIRHNAKINRELLAAWAAGTR
jgi:acyl-CoA synthetase (AMP-forming)/AMP-acid ligase II